MNIFLKFSFGVKYMTDYIYYKLFEDFKNILYSTKNGQ